MFFCCADVFVSLVYDFDLMLDRLFLELALSLLNQCVSGWVQDEFGP